MDNGYSLRSTAYPVSGLDILYPAKGEYSKPIIRPNSNHSGHRISGSTEYRISDSYIKYVHINLYTWLFIGANALKMIYFKYTDGTTFAANHLPSPQATFTVANYTETSEVAR